MANLIHYRPEYPDPLDWTNLKIPERIREDVFKMARELFLHDPIMSKVIRIAARYPITKILVDSPNPETRKAWEELIERIDLRTLLFKIGFDYFTYGNAFVIYMPRYRRTYVCKKCKATIEGEVTGFVKPIMQDTGAGWKTPSVKQLKVSVDPHTKQLTFSGRCPVCGKETNFVVTEKELDIHHAQNPPGFVIIDPFFIDIKHNPITNNSRYLLKIPKSIKDKITKDPFYVETTPLPIIEAVVRNKEIILDPNNIFHFKYLGFSGLWPGWGTPVFYPLFRLVYLIQHMFKATAQLAFEHWAPIRVINPAHGTGGRPFPAGFKVFESKVKQYLDEFRRSAGSAILVAPYPMTMTEMGGRARAYMMVPEIQALIGILLWGSDIPAELIQGGTWAGQFVAMRMMENAFAPYMREIEQFMDFVVDKLVVALHWPRVKLKLKPLRRVDDVSHLQTLMQGVQAGLVSKSTFLDFADMDYNEELKRIAEEKKMETEVAMKIQNEQIKAQAESIREAILAGLSQRGLDASTINQAESLADVLLGWFAQSTQQDPNRGQALLELMYSLAQQGDMVSTVALQKLQAMMQLQQQATKGGEEQQPEETEGTAAEAGTEEGQAQKQTSKTGAPSQAGSNVPRPPKRTG